MHISLNECATELHMHSAASLNFLLSNHTSAQIAYMRILLYQVRVWVSFAYRQRKCQLLFESRILTRPLESKQRTLKQHSA